MLRCHFDVAIGSEDSDAAVVEVAGQETQQLQGRLVRPVQVVKHDQEGSRVRGSTQEGSQAVEQPEPCLLWTNLWWRGQIAADLGNLRHEPRDLATAGPELALQSRWLPRARVRAHDLDPRPECRRTATLPTRGPDHPKAVCSGPARQLLSEPGLPDPRLTGDHEQVAPA